MLWSGSSSGMGWSPTDDRLMRCDPVCRSACNRHTHPPYTGYHHTPSSPYRVLSHTLLTIQGTITPLTIQGTITHPPHHTGYHHTPSSPYRVLSHTLLTIQGTITHPPHHTESQAANHTLLEPIITLQLIFCAKNLKCVRHVFLTS